MVCDTPASNKQLEQVGVEPGSYHARDLISQVLARHPQMVALYNPPHVRDGANSNEYFQAGELPAISIYLSSIHDASLSRIQGMSWYGAFLSCLALQSSLNYGLASLEMQFIKVSQLLVPIEVTTAIGDSGLKF